MIFLLYLSHLCNIIVIITTFKLFILMLYHAIFLLAVSYFGIPFLTIWQLNHLLSHFALQPSSGSHPYSVTSTQAQIPGAWFKILLSFLLFFDYWFFAFVAVICCLHCYNFLLYLFSVCFHNYWHFSWWFSMAFFESFTEDLRHEVEHSSRQGVNPGTRCNVVAVVMPFCYLIRAHSSFLPWQFSHNI